MDVRTVGSVSWCQAVGNDSDRPEPKFPELKREGNTDSPLPQHESHPLQARRDRPYACLRVQYLLANGFAFFTQTPRRFNI
jgi:hypothetical protein